MTRIVKKFTQLRNKGKIAFMPFCVAGYPDYNTSMKIVRVLAEEADLLELGFPYSDPLADGPSLQVANQAALKSGITPDKVFKFIKSVRRHINIPVVVLVYANLVYQRGLEKFYKDAKFAGVDGILIPDLPIEEARPYLKAAKKYAIDQIFMITQTTTNERIKTITKNAKGFIYLVTVLGTTGARKSINKKGLEFITNVKKRTKLPLAAGFGISTRRHVKLLKNTGVNGIIVGSALLKYRSINKLKNYLKQLLQ